MSAPADHAAANRIVNKLWSYCNVLRDDGMSYGDYVEQLTYLLFLKMADERSRPPYSQPSPIPAAGAGPARLARDGAASRSCMAMICRGSGASKGCTPVHSS